MEDNKASKNYNDSDVFQREGGGVTKRVFDPTPPSKRMVAYVGCAKTLGDLKVNVVYSHDEVCVSVNGKVMYYRQNITDPEIAHEIFRNFMNTMDNTETYLSFGAYLQQLLEEEENK